MLADAIPVATRFVDLVLKYEKWNEITSLPEDEQKILVDTVSIAGFQGTKIVSGKLNGSYRDQDGSSTGEKFPINRLSPFKVVSEGGDDQYLATGWLDCAIRRAQSNGWKREDRAGKISAIAEEIDNSRPLEPIQITPEGDLLQEEAPSLNRGGFEYFVKHRRDTDQLPMCIGVHAFCNGYLERKGATATLSALVCRSCYIRVLFPKEVKTYGELRQALATKFAAPAPVS